MIMIALIIQATSHNNDFVSTVYQTQWLRPLLYVSLARWALSYPRQEVGCNGSKLKVCPSWQQPPPPRYYSQLFVAFGFYFKL